MFFYNWPKYIHYRFLIRKQGNGVLLKGTYLTSRHLQKKISMLMLLSCLYPNLHWPMIMSKICKFTLRTWHKYLNFNLLILNAVFWQTWCMFYSNKYHCSKNLVENSRYLSFVKKVKYLKNTKFITMIYNNHLQQCQNDIVLAL